MKRKIVNVTVVVILMFGAIIGAQHLIETKAKPPRNADREQILSVKAEQVVYKDIVAPVTYYGRIYSKENISIAAEVSGKMLQGDIPFKTGQSFKKGDVLVGIYDEDMRASLAAQRSTFLNTLSQALPDIKIDYPESYEKWSNFFMAIDFEKNLPELPDFDTQNEKVFLASKSIISSYYSIKQQEVTLSKYVITAPFDGVFTQINKEIGSIAGMNGDLAKIIRTDKLEMVVPVLPAEAEWIKEGQSVDILISESEKINGTVVRIAEFVDASGQMINVYVALDGAAAQKVYEGQFYDVEFPGKEMNQVMVIPREAVFKNNQVWVVEQNELKLQSAEIVKKAEDYQYIRGPQEGQMLVIESLMNVKDGQRVNIIKANS